jgi:hypothetical protein
MSPHHSAFGGDILILIIQTQFPITNKLGSKVHSAVMWHYSKEVRKQCISENINKKIALLYPVVAQIKFHVMKKPSELDIAMIIFDFSCSCVSYSGMMS